MARYFARIVRAAVVSTLGFGGGTGLLVFIFVLLLKHDPHAFKFAWQAGLIIGLIFAFLVVAVLLPLDLTARLFMAKRLYKEIWELEQTRELLVEGTMKQVTQAARQALLVVPYVNNVFDDADQRFTYATSGISWRSPGEMIKVEFDPINEKSWKLKCTSKCRTKNVMFDYGKNFENVETWQRNFNERMKAQA